MFYVANGHIYSSQARALEAGARLDCLTKCSDFEAAEACVAAYVSRQSPAATTFVPIPTASADVPLPAKRPRRVEPLPSAISNTSKPAPFTQTQSSQFHDPHYSSVRNFAPPFQHSPVSLPAQRLYSSQPPQYCNQLSQQPVLHSSLGHSPMISSSTRSQVHHHNHRQYDRHPYHNSVSAPQFAISQVTSFQSPVRSPAIAHSPVRPGPSQQSIPHPPPPPPPHHHHHLHPPALSQSPFKAISTPPRFSHVTQHATQQQFGHYIPPSPSQKAHVSRVQPSASSQRERFPHTAATQYTPRQAQAPATSGSVRYEHMADRIRTSMSQWTPSRGMERALGCATSSSENPAPAAATESGVHVHDIYQEAAVRAAMSGESFLLTGSAGTGKSYVLRRIIRDLRGKNKKVIVTASTGCAAVNIKGATLHSALSIGIGLDTVEKLVRKIRSRFKRHIREELQEMNTLIIDEISMIEEIIFDKAEAVVRAARCSNKEHEAVGCPCPPFGGAQVIVCGDFFQLPPVGTRERDAEFCFGSEIFQRTLTTIHRLRIVHRQADWNFVGMLNEIRLGIVSSATQTVLDSCKVTNRNGVVEIDDQGDVVCFTKLFPFRNQVARENYGQLQKLSGESVIYVSMVQIDPTVQKQRSELSLSAAVRNVRVDHEIELRVGARILCLKNLDVKAGICNGTQGKVVGFVAAKLSKEKEGNNEENGDESRSATAFAKLAQERRDQNRKESIDGILSDLKRECSNEKENAEKEALKKVLDSLASTRSAGGIEGFCATEEKKYDLVEEGRRLLKEAPRHGRTGAPLMTMHPSVLPVVQFDNGITRVMHAETWDVVSSNGDIEATVIQIPMCLGYALSIHKAQGMTLSHVEADIGGSFDCGQVYVALSRVQSVEGLRLTSFDPRRVAASDDAKEFERKILIAESDDVPVAD